MTLDSMVKLRLSIWRDFSPNRSLIYRQSADSEQHFLNGDSDLQQEIFSWQMREDPFSGISDPNVREELRSLLVDEFEPSRPPSERKVGALQRFLGVAASVVDRGEAEWAASQDAPIDDEEAPYRLNPLLAFKNHLDWLVHCFADEPGVSVSIR